jgi:photosystem II stability/assembly factor-like uncharacterized protein
MRNLAILIMLLGYFQANAQWTIKHLDENSRRNTTVKFKNDSVGFAMGGYTYFLKTVDAGETWTKIPYQVTIGVEDFQFLEDSTVFAVGRYSTSDSENFHSRLIKSVNLGDSWETVSEIDRQYYGSLHFFNSDSGLLAGSQTIIRTVDGGASWDTVWNLNNYEYRFGQVSKIYFPSTEIGYAVGIGRNQHNNPMFDYFLLKSVNAGLSWEMIETFVRPLSSIYFNSPEKGFIGTEYGTAYKTSDGGDLWSEVQVSTNLPVRSIQFISEMEGFATGGSEVVCVTGSGCFSEFFISKTIDGGESWASYDTTGIPLHSIWFLNDTVGFVSGDYELIMKSNGIIDRLPDNYPWHYFTNVGIEENMAPDSGIKVYPNPTYGPLYIQNLNFNNEIKSISLINTAGQKVEIIYPDSNNNTIFHNLANYKPGLYFMQIECANRTEIRKIIKN